MQRYQDEAVEIGVRIKPMTRQQRRVLQDRDFLEKQRVTQRTENFERHEEARFTDEQYNEHHRFGDDFEGLERQKKEEKKAARQEYYQQLQSQATQREQTQLQRMEEEERKRQEAIQKRGNHKNRSGENFNILTREYLNPEDQQKEVDKYEHYRQAAEVRKQNLVSKSGGGMNILTGEQFDWAKK